MRRREFISMIAGATAWPLGARADQPATLVIGFLNPAPAAEAIPHLVAAFRRGLAEAGYVIHCRDVPHVRQHVERRCAGCGHPILPFCSRCRSNACDTLSHFCAWRVLCWPAFPSVPALGSTGSAADISALFVGFPATMAECDFPCPCTSATVPQLPDTDQCGKPPLVGHGISRFPYKERLHMPGSPTTPGQSGARMSHPSVLPSAPPTASAPGKIFFRGSMAGLCDPLPTLRQRPHGR
jgi:hypothetical protein